MKIFKNDWGDVLEEEMAKPYYRELRQFLIGEYRTRKIFPDMYSIFNALHETARCEVKCVILGQDPYHNDGQAHGLSFSVQEGIAPPPSLVNIFKELQSDLGCKIPNNGCLLPWAKRGVLLLNTVLTVRAHEANSHRGKGWETFTDRVISLVDESARPVVFMLWGLPARKKRALIKNPAHLVIESAHPSPLSAHAGFFGSKPFSRANEFLSRTGQEPIDWQLPDI